MIGVLLAGRRPVSLLVALLCATVSLLSDGGSGLWPASGAFVSASPPLPRSSPPSQVTEQVERGNAVRGLDYFVHRFAAAPFDERLALGLVDAAERAGRLDEVEPLLAAVRWRTPSAAAVLAGAELAYANGRVSTGLRLADAARALDRGSTVAALAVAAGRASAGRFAEAVGAVTGIPAEELGEADGLAQRLRWARILALVESPRSRAGLATDVWVEAVRRRDARSQARALLLVAALSDGAGDAASRRSVRRRAWELATRAGDRIAIATAVVTLAESTGVDGGHPPMVSIERLSRACGLLESGPEAAEIDCLLVLHGEMWSAGEAVAAHRLHRRLSRRVQGNATLEVRLAETGLPMLIGLGRHAEAAALAALGADAAGRLGRPGARARFLGNRALLERMLGRPRQALDLALEAIELVPGDAADLRSLLLGEAAEAAFQVGREERAEELSRRAVESSSDATPASRALTALRAARHGIVEISAPQGRSAPLPRRAGSRSATGALAARLLRAAVDEALGEERRALVAYTTGVDELSRWVDGIPDPGVRLAAVGSWRMVARRGAELAFRIGDPATAIAIVESTRPGVRRPSDRPRDAGSARGVDRLAGRSGVARSRLPARIPEGAVVLHYVVTTRSVWVAVLRSGSPGGEPSVTGLRLEVSPDLLRDRIELWRHAVRSANPSTWKRISRRLGADLLDPVVAAGSVDGAKTIYVVPDDRLHLISFAALIDSRDRTFGESSVWARTPSLRLLERRWATPAPAGRLAAFGPGGGADTIAELRAATAGLSGTRLLGARATESRWLGEAESAAVLHFAGHAEVPSDGPLRSALVLRGDRSSDGFLRPREILGRSLPGSWVVLLGCDTASRGAPGLAPHDLEVDRSLGEVFLAAGARAVVGNLWEVDEETARTLAEEFYARGGPLAGARALWGAVGALRARYPDAPHRWAGVVWIGVADAAPASSAG